MQSELVSVSKGVVRLHSRVSYAEGHVLTGHSSAYADNKQGLHTVQITHWLAGGSLICWNVPSQCTSVNTPKDLLNMHASHFQEDKSKCYKEAQKG